MKAVFRKAKNRRGELQLVCALTVAATSATFVSLQGDRQALDAIPPGVMDPYVERSIELGAVSRLSPAVNDAVAFGALEFVRTTSVADAPISSRIVATIHTRDGAAVDPSSIKHLVIGIRPNDLFRSTIADQEKWTDETSPILRQLNSADHTFVVLWARGYRLTSASAITENRRPAAPMSFLQLTSDFTPGRPIRLDLTVERESFPILRSQFISALGTDAELPPFRE